MRRRRGSGSGSGQKAGSAELNTLARPDNRLGYFVGWALAWCAGVPTAALAADLSPAIPPAVYKEPPAVYNWTGFYIGGNIGAAWQGLSETNFSDTIGSTFTAPTNVQFMGGAQLGVNYQFSSGLVIGAEAMFDWLPSTENTSITAVAPDGTAGYVGTLNNQWLTTATGRLGYAWDRVMFYGKGGAAWVGASNPAISINGVSTALTGGNNSNFGWTAGLGLEWAFWNNWSLRAEYDYIGLGNRSYTVAPGSTIFSGDVITYGNASFSVMTLAVNYKFGGW
jgi:outer membrane immunogenic protein